MPSHRSRSGDGTDATLTVTAALTDALLKSYSGTVYLFELPARCGRNPDLRGLTPVADAPAASSLRFSLSLYDGMRSRLFSSFVLASYDKTARQYTVLTSAVAVSAAAAVRFSAGFAGLSHIKNNPVSAAVTASAAAHATLFLVPVIASAFFSAPFLRVP